MRVVYPSEAASFTLIGVSETGFHNTIFKHKPLSLIQRWSSILAIEWIALVIIIVLITAYLVQFTNMVSTLFILNLMG